MPSNKTEKECPRCGGPIAPGQGQYVRNDVGRGGYYVCPGCSG